MSRIAAVAARIEDIISAIIPETRTLAGAARFVRSDRPLLADAAPRSFYLDTTGDMTWTGELAQDRDGAILDETFELTLAYRGSTNQRAVRDVIRQDALRIQYELLDPANWADGQNQWRCQRRQFGAVNATRDGEGDGAQILVSMLITLTYRPF